MEEMNSPEITRLILELRTKGWNDTDIINHILYITTGDTVYASETNN